MKLFITILMTLATAQLVQAAPVDVVRRDMKLPTQRLVERDAFTTPEAADDDQVLNDQSTSASATTTVTSFLAQPDVCRALSVTPGGSTGDVPAGDVVITGVNTQGRAISESITLTANQSSLASGTKAFCSVSSILFPVQDGPLATYDVGVIEKLGLKRCLAAQGDFFFSTLNGVKEVTEASITPDADEVEKNLVDLNSSLNGTGVVVYYIQNNACY